MRITAYAINSDNWKMWLFRPPYSVPPQSNRYHLLFHRPQLVYPTYKAQVQSPFVVPSFSHAKVKHRK